MSPEFIAILSIGATLAGTQLVAVLWLAGYVRGEICVSGWQRWKACSKGCGALPGPSQTTLP